ncbi:class I SAM-dependent methyltransferase [Planococcus donghaensis]|uniref:Methyltransferase type 11 n=1 Tax=Planococcus donghaensis TaxID=414778 RepID=A0A1C7EE16_9BACL|nr:methyltransferase domain-containing protein [Planococcus donghaensis]ANU21926.1 methyltransferase type 11 [Planococcus donghaensis]
MKKVAYDNYYEKENYFGNPYPGLVAFFTTIETKGTVLDLGCGQGRDALPLGNLGYKVIGVDHSSVGIEQLNRQAKLQKLSVEGRIGNVYEYSISAEIDIVLLDSMLHFYQNDLAKETQFVEKILTELKGGGIFVNGLLKGRQREDTLKQIIENSPFEWDILLDDYTEYKEANAEFHLFAIKKRS